MTHNNIFTDEQLQLFTRPVKMLSFDHGDGEEPESHGSGVFVRYKDILFFLCSRHSFHAGRSLASMQQEYYDSLAFILKDNELTKPKYTRVSFVINDKDYDYLPEEDMLLYEISSENWEYYREFYESAAILDFQNGIKKINDNQGTAYVCGYPSQYGGNTDYINKKVHQELKGRYVQLNKNEGSMWRGEIDTQGLVDKPLRKDEFEIDGMSGGALMTIGDENEVLFLGLLIAGTVASKTVLFLSLPYIKHVLDSWLVVKDAKPSTV